MNRTEAAIAILEDVPSADNGHPQIAITVILAIIATVVTVYRCLKEAPIFEPNPAVRNPNIIQRIRMRRIVRRSLVEQGASLDVDEVTAAILKFGANLSPDVLFVLANEANSASEKESHDAPDA